MNHSLVFHISNTAKKIQKSVKCVTEAGELSFSQAVALLVIDSTKGISQSEIAARLYLEPASVVSIIDELARLGLVTRETITEDRRKYLIMLTSAGLNSVKIVKAEITRLNKLTKSKISQQEYVTLLYILEKIDQKLEEKRI